MEFLAQLLILRDKHGNELSRDMTLTGLKIA